jgi:hypothetical protein
MKTIGRLPSFGRPPHNGVGDLVLDLRQAERDQQQHRA